ncbi:MAG: hypothetical protein HRU41_16425 [Saprospiraceae bacterium]|nr:hypothetical protein [Saprospiraceae bacterium]
MKDEFSELENAWSAGQKKLAQQQPTFADMQQILEQRKSASRSFQYGTLAILLFTLIGFCAFFMYVAPVKQTMSRVGAIAMLGGLTIRVLLEILSLLRLRRISTLSNSKENTKNSIRFHAFRVKTQSIYSPVIIAVFTVGFYLLTPEFVDNLSFNMVLFIDISYLFIAAILFYVIRMGVKKELQNLEEWTDLLRELEAD